MIKDGRHIAPRPAAYIRFSDTVFKVAGKVSANIHEARLKPFNIQICLCAAAGYCVPDLFFIKLNGIY